MAEEIDYRALYEQSQRDLEEVRRARMEERRALLEEKRALLEEDRALLEEDRACLEEKTEADRARAAERDAKALVAKLAKQLTELQRSLENQALQPYLGLIARLGVHFARLIPLPRSRSEQIVATSGSNTASKTKSGTTSGRTTIHEKYYPLRLRVWTDFPDLHRKTFSHVYATMADRRTLPSHQAVQLTEQELLDRNPTDAIQMEKALNERKTAQFLETLLETPTYRVLREYLTAISAGKWLLFDTTTHATAVADHSSPPSSARIGGAGNGPSSSSQRRRTQPDVVVLAVSAATATAAGPATAAPDAEPHRVVLGEHKPLHALRHTAVTEILNGPLPETYMVRLARAATRRHASADGAKQDGDGPSGPPSDPADESGSRSRRAVPKQVYFAYALTQIYHYMLLAGLEFGYIATGETLILLRIPENEPTTLLYHTAVFPVPSPQDMASYSGPVALAPPSETTDVAGEEALAALPVAQLASLCLLAFNSTPRTPLWVSRVLMKLALFPQLPEDLPSTASSPSSLRTRRRHDDDDDDGDDDDSSDGGGSSRGRTLRPPGGLPGSQARVPSPLQQVTSAAASSAGTFRGGSQSMHMSLPSATEYVIVRPHLPYCTQACLLGLVRNGPLDRACPNYLLHKHATTIDGSLPLTPALSPAAEGQDGKDDAKDDAKDDSASRHPLSLAQLQELVRTQLFDGPEDHCENLDGRGHYGAIGHLFKITVKGFGYTFVAKGVEASRRRRLVREAAVYAQLQAQQGRLVPVCLGVLALRAPYALLSQFLALPCMLLLSYAGATVSSIEWAREESQAEGTPARGPADAPDGLDDAMARTYRELWQLGLRDGDAHSVNFTWCAEAQRVMRIDFDRSTFVAADGTVLVKRKGDPETAAGQPAKKRAKA